MTNPKILVVDDDDAIRETLGGVLASEGYEVALAENGARALEVVREGVRPDLVLLDLMMPVMSGWEFLEVADSDDKLRSIPILIVSAMAAPLACQGVRGGVRMCFAKPIDLDALLDAVKEYSGPADAE
jgi:CheY-like chemotaxis protein